MVDRAAACSAAACNVLISGGTGSGKTTLLHLLVSLRPAQGGVISIEDTLEPRLDRANYLRFEARGLAARGVTIRDLVRRALRRPDYIVVREVRGAEAPDLQQAYNIGHAGCLATVHGHRRGRPRPPHRAEPPSARAGQPPTATLA